jgi:hypothetical protein
MATRATWFFVGSKSNNVTPKFCYTHYDGYPEGAAIYLYATLLSPSKGCFCSQFIRANAEAELTESHEIHGDTEYRYGVRGSGADATITAVGIHNGFWFCGLVVDFLAKYSELIEGFTPFKLVKTSYGRQYWANAATAKIAMEVKYGPVATLRRWSTGERNSANWQSCVSTVNEILAEFPELLTDELAGFGCVAPQSQAV